MNRSRHFACTPRALWIALAALLAVLAAGTALADRPAALSAEYEKAVMAHEAGELQRAVIGLKNILQDDPKHLPARLLLGQIYLEQGVPLAAQKELERARKLGADDARVRTLLGRAYLAQDGHARALEVVGEEPVSAKESVAMTVVRADAYLGLGNHSQAERYYNAALGRDPASVAARIGQARLKMVRQEFDAAESILGDVLERHPRELRGWLLKGQLRQRQGSSQAALDAYATAIDIAPHFFEARLQRAALLVDLNRLDAARLDVEAILAETEIEPRALYLKSSILAKQGKQSEAQATLQDAAQILNGAKPDVLASYPRLLRLAGVVNAMLGNREAALQSLSAYLHMDPTDGLSLKWMAVTQLGMSNPAAATDFLERALKANSRDLAAMNLLGTAHMRLGDYDRAISIFQAAAELAPAAPGQYQRLGQGYLYAEDIDAAVSAFSKAVELSPDDISANINLALAQLRAGDSAAAVRTVETILANNPEDPAVHQLAATVFLSAGRRDEARKALNEALRLNPDFRPAQLALGRLALEEGDLGAARKAFQSILDQEPDNVDALMGRGRVAAAVGESDRALSWFEKARAAGSNDVLPVRAILKVHLDDGDYDRAAQLAEGFLAAEGYDLEILKLLGDAYLAAGRAEKAIETYRTARTALPEEPAILIYLAEAQQQTGGRREARETLQSGIEQFPDRIPFYERLASLQLMAGETEAALATADSLAAAQPADSRTDLLKGRILAATGRYEEALAAYESGLEKENTRALAIGITRARLALTAEGAALEPVLDWLEAHPQDAVARTALAGAYASLGNQEAAIDHYEEALALRPGNAGLLNNLAWLYHETGDARALAMAENAHELAPDSAAVLDTLGWILIAEGETDRALGILRRAHVLDASDPAIRYHLATALAKLGRTEEAVAELTKALAASKDFPGRPAAETLLKTLTANTE